MRLDVAFLHAARAEFIDASAWYESRRSGLGREFIAEIDRCVARAAEQPLQYAAVHGGIRRVVANRFPYGVYFRTEETRVVIMAIFHSRRNAAIWQART